MSTSTSLREQYRDRGSGRFGEQPRTDPGQMDLDAPFDPSEPWDDRYAVGTDPHLLETFDWDAALGELGESPEGVTEDVEEDQPVLAKRLYSDVAKTERVEVMKADLAAAVRHLVESGQLAEWLDTMASNRLHGWSFNNQILATFQGLRVREAADPDALEGIPDDLMVMSAAAWRDKYGRFPRAGSKAIWVLAPCTRTTTETDPVTGQEVKKTRVYGFRAQPKFDACQTDGDPIPQSQILALHDTPVDPQAQEKLTSAITGTGYATSQEELSFGRLTASSKLGYTDPKTKRVVVDSRLSESGKVAVLAHELAHIKHGHVDDLEEYREHRGRMETEAEATAYMLTRHFGVDPYAGDAFSAGYIASWSKGDDKVLTQALTKATKVFNDVVKTDA